jgi:hypothetical protein
MPYRLDRSPAHVVHQANLIANAHFETRARHALSVRLTTARRAISNRMAAATGDPRADLLSPRKVEA